VNKLELLENWKASYTELATSFEALEEVVGTNYESPLGKAVWRTFDKYTDAIALLVGDKNDWLSWYCWEGLMGRKNLGTVSIHNKNMESFSKQVASLEDLLEVIEYESKV
jgi:hypothetical protein